MVYTPLLLEESYNISENRALELTLQEQEVFSILTERIDVLDLVEESKVGEFFKKIFEGIKTALKWIKDKFLLLVKKIKELFSKLFTRKAKNLTEAQMKNKYIRFNCFYYASNNNFSAVTNSFKQAINIFKQSVASEEAFIKNYVDRRDDPIINQGRVRNSILNNDIYKSLDVEIGSADTPNKLEAHIEEDLDKFVNMKDKLNEALEKAIFRNVDDNKKAMELINNFSLEAAKCVNSVEEITKNFEYLVTNKINMKISDDEKTGAHTVDAVVADRKTQNKYGMDKIRKGINVYAKISRDLLLNNFKSNYAVCTVLSNYCIQCVRATLKNPEQHDEAERDKIAKSYDKDADQDKEKKA